MQILGQVKFFDDELGGSAFLSKVCRHAGSILLTLLLRLYTIGRKSVNEYLATTSEWLCVEPDVKLVFRCEACVQLSGNGTSCTNKKDVLPQVLPSVKQFDL